MNAYRFALGQRSDGVDTAEAEWCGQHYRANATNGATMKLARTLVSARAPDGPWQAERGGRVALAGPSLHRLACTTVVQDERGERFVRWRPYLKAEVPEPLQNAMRAAAVTGKNGVPGPGRAVASLAPSMPLAAEQA
jgi:hypothetical protein